ncbi:875_t:CDS:2, partial [Ambispora gerdemannii]
IMKENSKREADHTKLKEDTTNLKTKNTELEAEVVKLRYDIEEIKKKDQIITNIYDAFSTEEISSTLSDTSNSNEFNNVKNLMKSDHIDEKKVKGQIYDFIIVQLNIKRIDKIQHIKIFSTDAISRFTNLQIQTVIVHFAKISDIEFINDQDNSSDDLPEAE